MYLGFAMLVWACGSTTKPKETIREIVEVERVTYKVESLVKQFKLFNGATCDVRLSMIRISGGLPTRVARAITESIQSVFFSETNQGILLDEKLIDEVEKIRLEYKQLEDDLLDKEGVVKPELYNWSFDYKVEFVGQDKRFITFRVVKVENVGAAHPRDVTTYVMYDLKTERVEHLDTYVMRGKMDDLSRKILDKIRVNFDSEEELKKTIWLDRLHATDNFYMENDVVTFYFNPFDIAPYAYGPIEVSFGKAELEGLLEF